MNRTTPEGSRRVGRIWRGVKSVLEGSVMIVIIKIGLLTSKQRYQTALFAFHRVSMCMQLIRIVAFETHSLYWLSYNMRALDFKRWTYNDYAWFIGHFWSRLNFQTESTGLSAHYPPENSHLILILCLHANSSHCLHKLEAIKKRILRYGLGLKY